MLHVLRKVVSSKGYILGMVVRGKNGQKAFIPKKEFKLNIYDNVKISSDYKVLGNVPEEVVNDITMFHGSKSGIVGKILFNKSRVECDFGLGFYTGDIVNQAKELCSEGSNTTLYTLSFIPNGFNIYRFEDLVEWALYVGYNRGYIDKGVYPKLDSKVAKISSYDVIYGLIADDRISTVFPLFMAGDITDRCLIECLKLVKYGNQYTFKNQSACDRLVVLDEKKLYGHELQSIIQNKKSSMINIRNRVEDVKKIYRREGRFVDEILEEWK